MVKTIFHQSVRLTMMLAGLFISLQTVAGTVELKGHVIIANTNMPMTAILHSYADESFSGTIAIAQDGSFSFSTDVAGTGLYNIRILRGSYDVMLSSAEKTETVNINIDNNEMTVERSPENTAYNTFNTAIKAYDTKLKSYYINCDKEDSCEKELHTLLSQFHYDLSAIADSFKGTYTATVLCPMRMPVIAKNIKNTSEELRKGFFEMVPFSDSTIFNTPVYKDMIEDYADFLTGTSISKENEFVKEYTAKIKANPNVMHKSAGLLFDDLYKEKKEKMLAMFIAWYNTADNKAAVNNAVLDMKLNSISKVMPGQSFINATGPDTAGTLKSLKDVVNKSKCTLLLFWSSECSHCREEMPSIKEYYKKYHSKGLNIYAISLDNNADKWRAFIKDNDLSWTNVNIGHSVEPNPGREYAVTFTPTMILIDNSGTILHRFISKGRLEADIAEAVK